MQKSLIIVLENIHWKKSNRIFISQFMFPLRINHMSIFLFLSFFKDFFYFSECLVKE